MQWFVSRLCVCMMLLMFCSVVFGVVVLRFVALRLANVELCVFVKLRVVGVYFDCGVVMD